MSIPQNIQDIKATLPQLVTLVAVSKTKPVTDLMEAYDAGQRIFGENKIQEMVDKWEEMPKDIEWHMIGHVQTNKVKFMAPFVSLIHGVDSLKLLKEINKQAARNNRTVNCLLQIHIAEEETKFGLDETELNALLSSTEFLEMKNIQILGLMGMATFTDNQQQVKKEFQHLKSIFDGLINADHGKEALQCLSKDKEALQCLSTEDTSTNEHQYTNCKLNTISMGMSGDYQLAIECGSTMVRIGSSIFGER